jgi:hypothetical protein
VEKHAARWLVAVEVEVVVAEEKKSDNDWETRGVIFKKNMHPVFLRPGHVIHLYL